MVDAIKTTFKRGRKRFVPRFCYREDPGHSYILNRLIKTGRLRDVDVYVDSPLADKATKIYMAHPEFFDAEAVNLFKFRTADWMRLHFTTSVEESQKINKIKSGAIIIAGSGMCEGGRIRHHFKHNLEGPSAPVRFTGFQVRGTLGRLIVDGIKNVRVLGEEMAVRAKATP